MSHHPLGHPNLQGLELTLALCPHAKSVSQCPGTSSRTLCGAQGWEKTATWKIHSGEGGPMGADPGWHRQKCWGARPQGCSPPSPPGDWGHQASSSRTGEGCDGQACGGRWGTKKEPQSAEGERARRLEFEPPPGNHLTPTDSPPVSRGNPKLRTAPPPQAGWPAVGQVLAE